MLEFEDYGIHEGVWSGHLRGAERPGRVCAVCHGDIVAEAVLGEREEDGWSLRIEIPGSVLCDGVTSLILVACDSDAFPDDASFHLGRLNLVAGKALDHDIAAEIAEIRAELELLKREFRRCCARD